MVLKEEDTYCEWSSSDQALKLYCHEVADFRGPARHDYEIDISLGEIRSLMMELVDKANREASPETRRKIYDTLESILRNSRHALA